MDSWWDFCGTFWKGPGWCPGGGRLGDASQVAEAPVRDKHEVAVYSTVQYSTVQCRWRCPGCCTPTPSRTSPSPSSWPSPWIPRSRSVGTENLETRICKPTYFPPAVSCGRADCGSGHDPLLRLGPHQHRPPVRPPPTGLGQRGRQVRPHPGPGAQPRPGLHAQRRPPLHSLLLLCWPLHAHDDYETLK